MPAALRKDLWTPLCHIELPNPDMGLLTFRRLREYRRLHELSYPLSTVTQTEGPRAGQLLPRKKRIKVLMNQKANSIADMAASLLHLDHPWLEKTREAKRRKAVLDREDERRRQKVQFQGEVDALTEKLSGSSLSAEDVKALESEREEISIDLQVLRDEETSAQEGKPPPTPFDSPTILRKGLRPLKGTVIRWANAMDAEYAETWPKQVVHGTLLKSRYTAAFPAMDFNATEDVLELPPARNPSTEGSETEGLPSVSLQAEAQLVEQRPSASP